MMIVPWLCSFMKVKQVIYLWPLNISVYIQSFLEDNTHTSLFKWDSKFINFILSI